jgi:hypothetical protein
MLALPDDPHAPPDSRRAPSHTSVLDAVVVGAVAIADASAPTSSAARQRRAFARGSAR